MKATLTSSEGAFSLNLLRLADMSSLGHLGFLKKPPMSGLPSIRDTMSLFDILPAEMDKLG